jgi:lysophospholipase L1-like esterase
VRVFDVAFIGDSLSTFEFGFWPIPARNRLMAAGGKWFRPYFMGIPGTTTAVSNSFGTGGLTMAQKVANLRPRACVIAYGMNDAFTAEGISIAQFGANLGSIVNTIRASAPTAIFLMTMNPSPNPAAVNRDNLSQYYSQIRTVASAKGANLIDNEAGYGPVTSADVPDNVHPIAAKSIATVVPRVVSALSPLLA